jgi:hypothetical protein
MMASAMLAIFVISQKCLFLSAGIAVSELCEVVFGDEVEGDLLALIARIETENPCCALLESVREHASSSGNDVALAGVLSGLERNEATWVAPELALVAVDAEPWAVPQVTRAVEIRTTAHSELLACRSKVVLCEGSERVVVETGMSEIRRSLTARK